MTAVGLLSVGAMGWQLARSLRARGIRVLTSAKGRSSATRGRAQELGVELVDDVGALVNTVEIIISLVPPASAMNVVKNVAESAPSEMLLVDANSIAPQTAASMDATLSAHGMRFVDASVMTLPRDVSPRMYVCGPAREAILDLDHEDFRMIDMGPQIGRASALKMCLSLLTKSTMGLWYAMLAAAERFEVQDELQAVLDVPHPLFSAETRAQIASYAEKDHLSVRASRWSGEMSECSKSLESLGAAQAYTEATERIFRLLAQAKTPGEVSGLAELLGSEKDR